MKRISGLESGEITVETLLSSRTYYNHDGYNRCLYCHKEVESSDWYIIEDTDEVEHCVSPTSCSCGLAKKELELKMILLDGLTKLDSNVDELYINKYVLNEKIYKLKSDYEEEYLIE